MIKIIAAIGNNNAIGVGGKLPWTLPADMQHFKESTMGGIVVMGRKTWQSLPKSFNGELPGRANVVLSRDPETANHPAFTPGKINKVFDRLQPILSTESRKPSNLTTWIIGGGEIYAQSLSYADELLITHVTYDVPNADSFFPSMDPSMWVTHSMGDEITDEDSGVKFRFARYLRIW